MTVSHSEADPIAKRSSTMYKITTPVLDRGDLYQVAYLAIIEADKVFDGKKEELKFYLWVAASRAVRRELDRFKPAFTLSGKNSALARRCYEMYLEGLPYQEVADKNNISRDKAFGLIQSINANIEMLDE